MDDRHHTLRKKAAIELEGRIGRMKRPVREEGDSNRLQPHSREEEAIYVWLGQQGNKKKEKNDQELQWISDFFPYTK